MACYNKKTGDKLALKVLRDGPKARREVDLHYLTNGHENVVSIVDIYENTFHDVKCLLMVCEFMEGGDLLTQFENQSSKPYTEEKVGEIIRQIGSAVMYLHDMNIAHRDIKLENILCRFGKNDQIKTMKTSSTTGEDCVYKLGDYGFAKRPERNVLMESPCCTPFYAPPEVLGRERYDKSCDMWSLGVAMYILLCGYPPFYSMKGLALSPGMRSRIAKGYYAFPHAEWDSVSQATKEDIRCLLRTNPSERMTIHELMNTPLVRGEDAPPTSAPLAIPGEEMDDGGVSIGIRRPSETLSFMPDDHDEEDLMHHADEVHDKIPDEIPKSVRFLRDGVKAPRLHSIQEEVGRALEMMRMGGDAVYVKQPNLAVCSNPLLAKRYKTAHMSISSVHCS
ncbi:hypothetical protein WR25_17002 isoform H [Diploscapter pachys]|uniref:non-specific serine/threonine protein kinase n=1 Tax=Diploscapter pachys TaxID=2018661 RepID=A0A2A2JKB7_9BILA|nr:hypothetical protein WR25_17002 isoform D [Diploscapter pachys]PAV62210.1 hypothetical protein WR25_17002 isoform H [Diploscapter pachys]